MTIELDISRRFNKLPVEVRQALFKLVSAYSHRELYKYNIKSLASLIGKNQTLATSYASILVDHRFLLKTGIQLYSLDRQKADSLITTGLLDLDEVKSELTPMAPANNEQDESWNRLNEDYHSGEELASYIKDVHDKAHVNNFKDFDDLKNNTNKEASKNPENLSQDDFEIKLDQKEKNYRFRVVEILDQSNAGRKIEPPMWAIADVKTDKLYIIAQDGLKFKDPDNSAYVGLKQLEFLKKNKNYILGVFKNDEVGLEKGRSLASQYIDTNVNNYNIAGFLPKRVGERFWVLQSARDGTYSVIQRGVLPIFAMGNKKVEKLTHDEAIGVFVASEAKAKEPKQPESEQSSSFENLNIQNYNKSLSDFKTGLDNTFNNFS